MVLASATQSGLHKAKVSTQVIDANQVLQYSHQSSVIHFFFIKRNRKEKVGDRLFKANLLLLQCYQEFFFYVRLAFYCMCFRQIDCLFSLLQTIKNLSCYNVIIISSSISHNYAETIFEWAVVLFDILPITKQTRVILSFVLLPRE